MNINDEPLEKVDNNIVWHAINKALKDLGMEHVMGGDGSEGFQDEYKYKDYVVIIGMKNV